MNVKQIEKLEERFNSVFLKMEINLQTLKDYENLYYYLSEKKLTNKNITINLKNQNFIEPTQVIILILFIIYNANRGCSIDIILPKNKEVANYIEKIGLIKFCATNYKQTKTINYIESLTAMPIRRIDTKNMNEYIDLAQKYFYSHCPNKDLTMLNLSIAELINNVHDHAQSEIDAYVFCQLFPRLKKIKVVVADLGVGIPTTVNKFLTKNDKKLLSESACLKWAIEENTSAQSKPHNKGKGLNTLHSFVKSNQSRLTIYSNDAYMVSYSSKDIYKDNPIKDFKGTIVEIIININQLPQFEEEDFLNF